MAAVCDRLSVLPNRSCGCCECRGGESSALPEHGGLCAHPVLGAGKTPTAPALTELLKMGGRGADRERARSQPSVRRVRMCVQGTLGVMGKGSEGPSPGGEGGELGEAPQREEVRPQNSEE